jgi:hypothetical protein
MGSEWKLLATRVIMDMLLYSTETKVTCGGGSGMQVAGCAWQGCGGEQAGRPQAGEAGRPAGRGRSRCC